MCENLFLVARFFCLKVSLKNYCNSNFFIDNGRRHVFLMEKYDFCLFKGNLCLLNFIQKQACFFLISEMINVV